MNLEVKTFNQCSPDYITPKLLIHIGEKRVATLNFNDGYWFFDYDWNPIPMGVSEHIAVQNTLKYLGYLG